MTTMHDGEIGAMSGRLRSEIRVGARTGAATIVASLGSLTLLLAACGPPEEPASNAEAPVLEISAQQLVDAVPRACPVTPPHPGRCGFGHRHGETSDRSGTTKITIASCNGVDDTAVIQDALTRADEVRLPEGICAVSGLNVVKKPVKLVGRGRGRTILKYRTRVGDSCMFFSNGGHTVIADVTFDGSRDTGAVVCGIFIRPKTCVGPVAITRVEVRNVDQGIIVSGDGVGTVNGVVDNDTGVGASPVLIDDSHVASRFGGIYVATTSIPNVRKVEIRRNDVRTDSAAAVMVRGLEHAVIANNRTRGGTVGVALESGGANVRFRDNDIAECSVAGVALGGGALNSGSEITVSNNHVSGCADGAAVNHMTAGRFERVAFLENDFSGNSGAGLALTAGHSLVVKKNRLENNGASGIWIGEAPPPGLTCGERCTAIDDVTIVGNIVRAGTALASAGLLVENATARGIRVRANDLRYDAPVPPYRPVALIRAPAAGELTFEANLGWPELAPAP